MELVLPPHRCELSLRHNAHLSSYETVAETFENQPEYYSDDSFPPGEKQRCIDANEMWTLHWYPDTPVGFHVIHAATLEALNQAVATRSSGSSSSAPPPE